MKTFWKDYVELCKLSGSFYKKHWFGIIVMSLASGLITFGLLCKDEIGESIKSKLERNEEES